QARDERPYALAVGAEVAHGAPDRPGGALQGERHLEPGERTAQPAQPVDGRVPCPADRPDAGARRNPLITHLMLQQVEQLVARVREAAGPEGDRPGGEALRRPHPEAMRLLGAQGREPTAARTAKPRLLAGD